MGYGMNIFDYIEDPAAQGEERAHWSARAPFRPRDDFDLMLVPRVPDWRQHEGSRRALERIEEEPWVETVSHEGAEVLLRLDSAWIEQAGGRLEAGAGFEAANADLVEGKRYAVYFWGANTTKALHIGHLRNLAIGHAIGAALEQAGARVERRSLICDVGRSMGEAMAGVVQSGRDQQVWPDGEEKSDHFVGACYADYVKAGRANGASGSDADDGAEDSVARESSLYNDKADELMMRVLRGDQGALELWSKTRAWVISGQRKTLTRLGIAFDRVIFESDFLPEVQELTNQGLSEGTLTRRYGDDMVMYETEREELEEMPLVRADGLPTQHMRALAYWSAAPELDDVISLQVCGTEWVAHVTCRRQLIDELEAVNGNGNGSAKGGGPPTHDVFHGMVARDRASITSSKEGALLIDDLAEWLDERIDADPERAEVRRDHPDGDRIPAQIALGYFLLQPTSKRVDFEPEKLLREEKGSLGWDLARAQAHRGTAPFAAERAAEDPDYRFAVVQSELYRRHLRSSVEGLDVVPLARYLSHFARWYREEERSPEVERVVRTVLDQGTRGLGLEGS
jgi:arginyl-tRNA synthetase